MKEHIEELREWLQGRRPGWDIRPAVRALMHEAADALEAKAAPVAYITGQFAGRCVIEAINRAAVLPTGMALYSHPQPSAGVVVPHSLLIRVLEPITSEGYINAKHELLALMDEFARLNGKEVGRG